MPERACVFHVVAQSTLLTIVKVDYSKNPQIRTSASKNLQPNIWGFLGMKIVS